MRKIKIIFAAFIVSFASYAVASELTGEIYAKGSQKKQLLYTYKNEIREENGKIFTNSEYKNTQGEVVVHDSSEMDGVKLVSFATEQKQLNQSGKIEVKDGQVYFTYVKDGKTSTAHEKATDNLVLTSNIMRYLEKNWSKIMAGEDVNVRFAVWDRMETVGFTLRKEKTDKVDGQDVVIVKMKATSFIIAAIVDPVYFTLKADGSRLISMVGRVAPKQNVNGQWKDLDAEVYYSEIKK